MATLSNADRLAIWAEWQSTPGKDDGSYLKHELRAAVDLMDQWANANQGSMVASLGSVTVGDATFVASTDTWTSASHGLAVGDSVRFTAVGTSDSGVGLDVTYWVVAATTNTFQLSFTPGGSVIDGTEDSVGTFTVEDRRAQGFLDGSTTATKAWLFAEVIRKRYDVGA